MFTPHFTIFSAPTIHGPLKFLELSYFGGRSHLKFFTPGPLGSACGALWDVIYSNPNLTVSGQRCWLIITTIANPNVAIKICYCNRKPWTSCSITCFLDFLGTSDFISFYDSMRLGGTKKNMPYENDPQHHRGTRRGGAAPSHRR